MNQVAPMSSAATEVDYDPFAEGELEQVVPTTEPQREVWLAAKLATDASLAYNESVSLRLRGRLEIAALERALVDLVSLHDALRTTFSPDGDTFCVLGSVAVPLLRTNLADLTGDAMTLAVQARQRASVETPFVLEQGPLLRTELLHLSADEHVLVLSAHHIVCDGWSWWVIVRELGSLYASACGHAVELLPMSGSYTEFALAENQRAGSAAEREDEAYWLSRFPDEAPALDLPTDRPRPGRRGFASSREDYVLDADLVLALRKLGARSGASLFATLLAGFGAVLSRISGQQDVVIGIPAAGQSVDGHDNLVGHCVNLLPLRFDMQPGMAFNSVLGQSKEILLDAIEHQRYTFGTLLKKIRVARDPSRLPLVSVMFNIDQALDQEREVFPGLALEFTTNPRSFENFELSINAVQCSGELRLECQYNRGLFETSTVRRWLSAYESLLRSVVHQSEAPISRLALVDVAARMDLAALQPAPEPYDRELLMHEGFERACDADPTRIAVVFGDQSWSYAQLEVRSNQIARLLRAHGARRGTLVGLAVDRGPDMLASLLGILKTGAGYVPLDPQFPADRIAYMAGDAGLAALLTQAIHAPVFALGEIPVIALDAAGANLDQQPGTRLPRDRDCAGPETTAYVIYTSGSTGKPKGVQVPHRAVVNFLAAMRKEPGIVSEDILVAVTTLSFDIAVLELMLPLNVGARVVIGSRDTVMDGGAFMRLLSSSRATMLQATPAMWRLLLDAGWRGGSEFKALCGGEPLPHDLATQLLSRCGQLWNLYGPTETTVWSTCARILPALSGATPDVHIGRPILNTRIWILDEHGELCPRGVPGEICIGGEGVTSGYLHRPELTAEKFIADRYRDAALPTSPDAAPALLYRTGDRGRWRNDGNLEHLGRLDFQVKVRGYRIELGEIESNLSSHAEVSRNIVMAREDRPGDTRLVAYVVLEPGSSADETSLLSHLRSTLPDYMVPQHVMVLGALPLLPNGKIDRKALPAPDLAAHRASALVAPRNPLEQQVAAIMAGILGLPEVGIHDNFFAMGGHSLLAAQLTSRLNRELEVSLSLRALFDGPTVERLAQMVSEGRADPTQVPRAPIVHRHDQSSAPLSLIQERLKLLEDFNPGQLTYNTPSAHWLNGPLDVTQFDRAFQEVMRRQSVLRTTISERDGEGVQIIHEQMATGLDEVEDLTHLPVGERLGFLMQRLKTMIETPFELFDAPLFRARLFKFEHDRHALLFMTHHIIWDGWSFDLFYKNLAEIYAARLEGREPDLPELTVSYGDFAVWHREWVKSAEYERQLEFWRKALTVEGDTDEGGPLNLSRGKHKRPSVSGKGMSQSFHVDRATTDSLRKLGLSMDATLFVVLLTAYFVLLNRVTGQKDMIVATPVRGRNSAEVEELMGYFTNLLPLRVRIDPALPFSDAVARVKDVMLDSFANPDIRLEEVGQQLSSRGSQRLSALYQTLFSMQDIRQRVTQWGNVKHERLEVFQPGATEDLGLWLLEGESGVAAGLVYNADVIVAEDVANLRRRYQAILAEIVQDPRQRIDMLGQVAAEQSAAQEKLPAQEEARTPAPAPAPTPTPTPAPAPALAPAPVVQPVRATTVPVVQAATTVVVPSTRTAPPLAMHADPRIAYLVQLWSEMLNTTVTENDNFFDLGGHSMVAVQMANKVAKDTGARLKLMPLATQTLGQIAMELPASMLSARTKQVGLSSRVTRGLSRLLGRADKDG